MRQSQKKSGRNELTTEMNKELYETASQSVLRPYTSDSDDWLEWIQCMFVDKYKIPSPRGSSYHCGAAIGWEDFAKPLPSHVIGFTLLSLSCLRLRSGEIPLRELGVGASWESARAPSARRFASIRERVELTRFWHLVPHLLTTLIWFPLKTWLLYMIFNSIFSAFACLETPYVYVARGVLYHPACACGLLESYSLSQCCSHAPRSFSGSYRLYFAGNIQIRWDIIECIELTCAFNYKLAI